MSDKPDLLLVYVPWSGASTAFTDWFSSQGKAALSEAAGSNAVGAFRTVKGPAGFNILLRTQIMPLDNGMSDAVRRILQPICQGREQPQIGLFRLAVAFRGASEGETVKTLFVVGRSTGSIPLEEFRQWYDEDHMGGLANVPGIVSATRYEMANDPSQFLAIYEVSNPDVMSTTAWKDVSKTAWTKRVRSRYGRWLDFTSEPIGQ